MKVVVAILVGTVASAIGILMAAEVKGWISHLQRRLLDHTVKKLPEEAQDRYAEELESLMEGYADRPIAGLLQALSLRLNRGALARECVPPVPKVGGNRSTIPSTLRVARQAGHTIVDTSLVVLELGIEFLEVPLILGLLAGPVIGLLFIGHVL